MDDWRDRPGDLLHAGESVVEEVDAVDSRLVVTTHRLLAFTPDAEPRFRQVDRPNVLGVEMESAGRADLLRKAARPAGWGAVALLAGSVLSLDSLLVPVEAPSGVGIGGVLGLVRSLSAALALLDDALRAVGAILLLVAVALAALYVRSRERAVVVEISGADDLRVPADPTAAVLLRDALDPE